MKIANVPSISVGIIHGLNKEPIFRKSYGLRNFEKKAPCRRRHLLRYRQLLENDYLLCNRCVGWRQFVGVG
jgi:hypothetical protein